jgi:hypothetical protein
VSGENDYCPGAGADYNYPADSLNTGSNIYVANNVWNPPGGFTNSACKTGVATPCETLNAYNPGNWSVTANLPNEGGAVLSAPQVRTDVGFVPISNFHSLTASSSDNLNAVSGTGAEFGYDTWSSTSGSSAFSQEMMVWTDTVNRGVCGGATVVATGVPFGGSNGVPLLDWNLCVNGLNSADSEWIWYLPGAQDPSNTVDLYGMFEYMISHGHYSSATGLNQLDETFELCSTGGQFEKFTASNLAITATT